MWQGFIAPISLPLVGFLMFGNLLRECGVLDNLSQAAQNELVNIVSILLGITISVKMQADLFLNVQTLMIILVRFSSLHHGLNRWCCVC